MGRVLDARHVDGEGDARQGARVAPAQPLHAAAREPKQDVRQTNQAQRPGDANNAHAKSGPVRLRLARRIRARVVRRRNARPADGDAAQESERGRRFSERRRGVAGHGATRRGVLRPEPARVRPEGLDGNRRLPRPEGCAAVRRRLGGREAPRPGRARCGPRRRRRRRRARELPARGGHHGRREGGAAGRGRALREGVERARRSQKGVGDVPVLRGERKRDCHRRERRVRGAGGRGRARGGRARPTPVHEERAHQGRERHRVVGRAQDAVHRWGRSRREAVEPEVGGPRGAARRARTPGELRFVRGRGGPARDA